MNSGKIKTLFIINPILEKKSGKNISRLISDYLDHERFEPTILYSEYPGHTSLLARQNVGPYQLIVAGGGDGTAKQIADSLVHSETAMGILPLGSGKGLARSLRIPLDIRKAIDTINEYKITRIDTGLVGKHRFVNIAGIGFAAEVAYAYSDSGKRGFLPYAVNTARKLLVYLPISAEVTLKDQNISGNYFNISFANSTQWGYGAHISPNSKPNDGFLEICVLRKFPKIFAPVLALRLFTKSIDKSRYMDIIQVEMAELSGNESFKGHIDGEPVLLTAPLKVSVDPGSLKVVCAD